MARKIFGLSKVLRLVFDTAALRPEFENTPTQVRENSGEQTTQPQSGLHLFILSHQGLFVAVQGLVVAAQPVQQAALVQMRDDQ